MGRKGFNRDIKLLTFISCMVIGLIFPMSEIAYCKGETKTGKENLKQNKVEMKKAETRNSGRWRPFTRATNPGENISKKGIKKGKYLFSGHLKGPTPSENTYKKNMGIPQKHTKKELVSGFYKPDQYKQSDIKGDGTKRRAKQEISMKNVPSNKVRITRKTAFK